MLPIDNPERVVQVVRSDNGYVYNVIRGTFLVHDRYVEFKTNPPKRQFGDPQLSVKIYRDEIGVRTGDSGPGDDPHIRADARMPGCCPG